MSTQAPGPDGHTPDGERDIPTERPADGSAEPHGGFGATPSPYTPNPYARDAHAPDPYTPDPYTRNPPAGDLNSPGGQPPPPYHQGGDPRMPDVQGGYPQNPYAPGPFGQAGPAPNPYGQPYFPQKSRVVAGLLGILLGALGIHRFYLGFTTIGVIQILMSTVLIFFTFGLSAIAATIWGLVEGIMILVGAQQFQRDAHGVPLKD